jgi:hypothetical protein
MLFLFLSYDGANGYYNSRIYTPSQFFINKIDNFKFKNVFPYHLFFS